MPLPQTRPQVTFPGGQAAAYGFAPFPLEAWGATTGAASRCATVTDTLSNFAASSGTSPYNVGNIDCPAISSERGPVWTAVPFGCVYDT